jgi:hypothetical protein
MTGSTTAGRVDTDTLKRERPLADVVASFGISLRPEGAGTYGALCPFHKKRTPSFWIDARDRSAEHYSVSAAQQVATSSRSSRSARAARFRRLASARRRVAGHPCWNCCSTCRSRSTGRRSGEAPVLGRTCTNGPSRGRGTDAAAWPCRRMTDRVALACPDSAKGPSAISRTADGARHRRDNRKRLSRRVLRYRGNGPHGASAIGCGAVKTFSTEVSISHASQSEHALLPAPPTPSIGSRLATAVTEMPVRCPRRGCRPRLRGYHLLA